MSARPTVMPPVEGAIRHKKNSKGEEMRRLVAFLLTLALVLTLGLTTAMPAQAEGEGRSEARPIPVTWDAACFTPDEHGKVEAVVKLTERSLERVRTNMVVGELRSHAGRTQESVLAFLERKDAVVLNTFWLTNAVLVSMPADLLPELARLHGVEAIFPNFEVTVPRPVDFEVLETGADYVGDVTWGLDKIGVPKVWDMGITGAGVRVVVLDTGVDMTHPDLAGRMWTDDSDDPYYPGGWIEFDADGNVVPSLPYDSNMHGTHVSGTVLGADASGTAIGVAPGAYLMHGLVLPGGYGTFAQVIAGMEWAMQPFDR